MNLRLTRNPRLPTAALTACAAIASILPAQQSATIPWQSDLAAARAQAEGQHAPLFVVFRCER